MKCLFQLQLQSVSETSINMVNCQKLFNNQSVFLGKIPDVVKKFNMSETGKQSHYVQHTKKTKNYFYI